MNTWAAVIADTPVDALEVLRVLGIKIRTDGEKLFVSPAELLDDDVRWLVRTHKAGLIAELSGATP